AQTIAGSGKRSDTHGQSIGIPGLAEFEQPDLDKLFLCGAERLQGRGTACHGPPEKRCEDSRRQDSLIQYTLNEFGYKTQAAQESANEQARDERQSCFGLRGPGDIRPEYRPTVCSRRRPR